jgi:hypothetical protein
LTVIALERSSDTEFVLRRDLFGLQLRVESDDVRLLDAFEAELPEPMPAPPLLRGGITIALSCSHRPPPPPVALAPGYRGEAFHQEGERLWLRTEQGTEFYGDAGLGEGRIFCPESLRDRARSELAAAAPLIGHLLRGQGLGTIHASAVRHGAWALLACGVSGSGKSSLAALLADRNGWELLADDRVLVLSGKPAPILPYPGRSSLRSPADRWLKSAHPVPVAEPLQIRALLFPKVAPEFPSDVQRVTKPEALKRLMAVAVSPGPWVRRHLETAASLARETPGFAVTLGENWEGVPEVLERLLERDGWK